MIVTAGVGASIFLYGTERPIHPSIQGTMSRVYMSKNLLQYKNHQQMGLLKDLRPVCQS